MNLPLILETLIFPEYPNELIWDIKTKMTNIYEKLWIPLKIQIFVEVLKNSLDLRFILGDLNYHYFSEIERLLNEYNF